MTMARVWKTGEPVRIGYADRTVTGSVLLASGNGWSLMLEFDALLGGYAGRMPVLWNESEERFECLIVHRPVTLSEVRP
jgi:hypothetical protein